MSPQPYKPGRTEILPLSQVTRPVWLGLCSQNIKPKPGTKWKAEVEVCGQVRVVQGKEPPHFLAIFGGNFTVFSGGVASAFDDVKRSVEVGSTYLLQIHGR